MVRQVEMNLRIAGIATTALVIAILGLLYIQKHRILPLQRTEPAAESKMVALSDGSVLKVLSYSPPVIRDPKLAKIVNRSLPLDDRLAVLKADMLSRPNDPQEVAALISVVGDPLDDETIRDELAGMLYQFDLPGFVETLTRVIESEPQHPRFRTKATQYLGWSLAGIVTEGEKRNRIIAKLRQLLEDRDVSVRREAQRALVSQRDTKGSEAAVKWLLPPSSGSDDLREVAIRCVHDLDLREEIPAVRQYVRDPTPSVRIAAIEVLGAWGDEASRSVFEESANSKLPVVQAAGKAALNNLEPTLDKVCPVAQRSVETLTKALSHPSGRVRDEAARFLKPYGEKAASAAAALTEALKVCDRSKPLRRIANYVEALRAIGPEAAIGRPALLEMLSESSPIYNRRDEREVHAFRAFILITLTDIGMPVEALPHILDYLNNAEPEMQFTFAAGARAAGSLGTDANEAITLLQRALQLSFSDGAVYFDNFDAVLSGSGRQTSARIEAIKALERIGSPAKALIPQIRVFAGSAGDATNYLPSCKEAAAQAIEKLER
jgi:HEAT repeat protein